MSKKYVIAEGFAFTSNGIVFSEGNVVDLTLFNGNEELLKKAISDGKIVEAKELPADVSVTDTIAGAKVDKSKPLSAMTKAELEIIAKEKGFDVAGKNKADIFELLKDDKKSEEASDVISEADISALNSKSVEDIFHGLKDLTSESQKDHLEKIEDSEKVEKLSIMLEQYNKTKDK